MEGIKKDLSMSWDELMEVFLEDNPEYSREIKRSIKYWKKFSNKEIWEVKRSDIYGKNSFREFLKEEIKSDNGKNRILFLMDKFYNYFIVREKCNNDNFSFINPFDYKFDKFKILIKYSTHREVIPKEVIDLMKVILIENDFSFGKKFRDDYLGNIWCPSTTVFLYTLLSIPIRGIQGLLLDSGLGDEFVYDFELKKMVKNLGGEKGRREGFIRMSHYSGLSNFEKECLWISTNKSMNQGYELNYFSEELFEVIKYQLDFLMKFKLGEKRSKVCVVGGVDKNYPKFYFLFRDICSGDGMNPVSKSKVYKLWKRLCREVENRIGFKMMDGGKCRYGLHNIRVSLISYALDSRVDLGIVSQGLAGHGGVGMTLYYYRSDKLRDKLKIIEGNSGLKIESLKLLGGSDESN